MFIIQNIDNKKHFIIKECDVVFDDATVEVGDKVQYTSNKKKLEGIIKLRGEKMNILKTKLRDFNNPKASTRSSKQKPDDHPLKIKDSNTEAERKQDLTELNDIRRKRVSESPESDPEAIAEKIRRLTEKLKSKENHDKSDEIPKTNGQSAKIVDLEEDSLSDGGGSKEDESSKPRLPNPPIEAIIKETNQETNTSSEINVDKENGANKSKNLGESSDEVVDDENSLNNAHQMFGKDWPDQQMIHLKKGIYCKKKILMSARSLAKAPSQLARRLLVGVFKLESLLNSTFSGQTSRAHPTNTDDIESLDETSKSVIIEYALHEAKKHPGWPDQTIEQIQHSMSQKIGELKRESRNAKSQANGNN